MAVVVVSEVLLVLGPSTGGIRAHVSWLRDALEERGWSVRVAAPAGVLDDTDHIVAVPTGWGPLRAALRGADLVHAHGLRAGWLAALTPRRRIPLVVTSHNRVLASGLRGALLQRGERALTGRVNAVIATAPDIAQAMGSGPAVVTVPPAARAPRLSASWSRLAIRAALGAAEGDDLVVAVARLHPQKDIPTLLRALARLAQERPRPRLRAAVVGDGPLERELVEMSTRLGLADVVAFAGRWANGADALAAADVVAVSSTWESGPLVVAEALSLGRPVVATSVGFVPLVMADGAGGRVVPVGDDKAMADAIGVLLDDPDAATVAAAAGRDRVKAELDPDLLADRIVAVYERAMSR